MSAEEPWRISLLGGLRAKRGELEFTRLNTRRTDALLAYLAWRAGAPQSREHLASLLWGDREETRARSSLSNALSCIRKALEPEGTVPGSVLIGTPLTVHLSAEQVDTDVREFEAQRRAAQGAKDAAQRHLHLARAADLYAGDLVPGLPFVEALEAERLRLRQAFLDVLEQLVRLEAEAGQIEAAFAYAERAVQFAPAAERGVALLMQLYARTGRHSAAAAAYERLERHLRQDYADAPSASLRALRERLRSGASGERPLSSQSVPGTPAASVAGGASCPPPQTGASDSFWKAPLSVFFGRDAELTQLHAWLNPQAQDAGIHGLVEPSLYRLVTVTGLGGCGKTRLAVACAQRLHPSSGGVAWLVSLAGIADARHLLDAIATEIGLPPSARGDLLEQIARRCEGRPALLLLDNFEHLSAEGSLIVRTLLARCPSLRCLVTSRVRLDIEGEQELPLAPLPVPVPNTLPEQAERSASVRLFADRAKAARPGFALTPTNRADVYALCRHLDGLPLALELAAARVAVLTPSQMLAQLDCRLDWLTTARPDAPVRHGSLRATMQASFDLLAPDLQRLFARLSAFRGGWDVPGAQTVCQEALALDYLQRLAAGSLVVSEPSDESVRFHLLETVREFAQEKLREAGDAAETYRAHLHYFLALAEGTDAQIREGRQQETLRLLDREFDNLRAALSWGWQREEDTEAATRLALGLHQFWELRGYLQEGREQYARALAWPGIHMLPALRSRLFVEQGTLEWRMGDLLLARSSLLEGLACAREQGDAQRIAYALHVLGIVEKHLGNYGLARECYEEALGLREGIGDEDGIVRLLNNLAILHMDEGRHEEAQAMHERCLPIRRRRNDLVGLGATLNNLGVALTQLDDYATAKPHFEESLRIRRELGDRPGTASCLLNLAMLACHDEDYAVVRKRLRECLELARQIGDRSIVSHALVVSINVAKAQRQDRQAVRLCGAVESLREEIGSPLPPAFWKEYTDERDELKSALGEAAFAEEFARGRLGGWEQAVAPLLISGAD